MTLSPAERQFLTALADHTKGRRPYSAEDYERARPLLMGLIEGGYIRERRLGLDQGVQILPKGRAYLNPTGDQ